ncbi:MAG: hypothetical protein CMI09_04590 [Oceanospirillaceae bacterium]|nr:hypothetical protein [Oceanospirillaceae bacterium]|tara:strand:- start:366 stop:800 length:435 start_codon:yes stop_codon:yes gene_type:complete
MLKTKNIIILGVLVGGAFAFPYFMKGPDGKPLMDLDIDTTISTEQTRQTFYKWQDGDGVWQFGDNPPEGVAKIAVNVDTAANILRSDKVAPTTATAPREFKPEIPKPGTNAILNPGAAQDAVENAKALQGVLDDRAKLIDEVGR